MTCVPKSYFTNEFRKDPYGVCLEALRSLSGSGTDVPVFSRSHVRQVGLMILMRSSPKGQNNPARYDINRREGDKSRQSGAHLAACATKVPAERPRDGRFASGTCLTARGGLLGRIATHMLATEAAG